MKHILLITFLLIGNALCADNLTIVKKAFEDMRTKLFAFDASGADYYSDEAIIKNIRTYPNGKKRTLKMNGAKYKELLKMVMPLAKKKGDQSTFKKLTYEQKEGIIIIKAKRWSVLKKHETPYEVHFKVIDGAAKITKETSHSKP